MANSTLWLSQAQFFLSLGFFSLFLMLELGLAWVLLFFKLGAAGGRRAEWMAAYRFWVRVFALAIILTLASSMPVLIQVGSIWPGLMDKIGDAAGPMLAGAILTTFVFKSCFLGAMLFGQRHLPERVHTAMVFMVAVGVTLAVFWLVALVGWMQAPDGALFVDGQYHVYDWRRLVANSFAGWLFGLLLVLSALAAAFLLMGVSARQSLLHPPAEGEHLSFRTGLALALAGVLVLAAVVAGYGQQVARLQPAKAAATAAYWHSGARPELVLLGWPDEAGGRTLGAVALRGGAAPWLGRDAKGGLAGLDQFSGMAPPVALVFWSFRLLVAAGLLMALLAGLLFLRVRKRDFQLAGLPAPWRRLLAGMGFLGWVPGLAGLAHVLFGLSPYAVNGTVTLAEIAGDAGADVLAAGVAAYALVYAVLLLGFFQLLRHIVRYGVVPVARRRGRA